VFSWEKGKEDKGKGENTAAAEPGLAEAKQFRERANCPHNI
jgi:hypothetical protein